MSTQHLVRKTVKQIVSILVAVIAIAIIGTALVLRKSAGGLRNVFSLSYWKARSKGEDLYNPAKNLFKRGSRDYSEVLLTIDDGPHPASIGPILDILKKEGVHATFFVVGTRVKQSPQIVRRMIDEGHEVGNHTQDHLRLDKLDEKHVRAEIAECALNVERACGRRMTLFRPPGLSFNATDVRIWKQMGYTTVAYNVGAKDFTAGLADGHFDQATLDKLNASSAEITDRVLKQVQNGSIILLHDSAVTAQALPAIIDSIKAQGYTFRTTAQMLQHVPHCPPLVANPPAKGAL